MKSNSITTLTVEQIKALERLKKEYESAEPYKEGEEPPDLLDGSYPPEIEARKRATAAQYFLKKYNYI